MKSFNITQRNGNQHTVLVDDADYDEVMKYKWHVSDGRNTFYVGRNKYLGTFDGKKKYKYLQIHRQLLDLTDPKIEVDHRDHNGLNNQRENLRVANHNQNQHNQAPRKNTSSKYKGVSWDKSNKKWQANIKINGKQKKLGRFTNEYEAHLIYEKAAKELFGEFNYKK